MDCGYLNFQISINDSVSPVKHRKYKYNFGLTKSKINLSEHEKKPFSELSATSEYETALESFTVQTKTA